MQPASLATDVLISGGGPAGLAAAIAARQKGLRAVVVEVARPSVDKACGEGLMPEGVRALGQLGISIGARECFPIRGIRFLWRGETARAEFPGGAGLGVRRTTLHSVLAERAMDTGVSMMWGARVYSPARQPAEVNGELARYKWLVGADGMNSRVRLSAGLETARRKAVRFGFRRHFRIEPWTDYVEVYWGRTSQLFVTPVSPEEVCVALLSRYPQPRLMEAIPSFPEIARRLKSAAPSSAERGAATFSRRLREVARGRIALVGDASGCVDAITGQGLCLAFQQALALAGAIEKDDLASYEAAHRRIMRGPTLMAKAMLAMDRHEWLRRRVFRGLSSEPGTFSRCLALHTGALPPPASRVVRALITGGRLLAP